MLFYGFEKHEKPEFLFVCMEYNIKSLKYQEINSQHFGLMTGVQWHAVDLN